MAITQLSPAGIHGRRYSFSAKTPASIPAHTGLFTHLGPDALSGRRRAFVAKTPATGGGHTGTFTWLSPSGTPGKRYTFLAKEPASVVVPPITPSEIGGGTWISARQRITISEEIRVDDDDEILLLMMQALGSILH